MRLNELFPPKGAVKSRKRLGRGESSGLGKTSGRGHKGQKARSGGFHKKGFEGGQMPLQRRLPKRGFRPLNSKEYTVMNVGDLAKWAEQGQISIESLKAKRAIKNLKEGLKILGDGELTTPLTVRATCFSKTAKEKIEKAGGTVIKEKGV